MASPASAVSHVLLALIYARSDSMTFGWVSKVESFSDKRWLVVAVATPLRMAPARISPHPASRCTT
eukprot:9361832-Pyramimonas_sp.AAC.1